LEAKMKKYSIPRGEALDVYKAEGAFDKCVDELKANGLEMITAKQLAEARMLGGANHPVSKSWSWVAESFNYLPNGNILIASKTFNPLLQYPSFAKQATDCHSKGEEFYLNDEVVSYLLEGAKHKDKVLQLKRKDVQRKIPTDAFGKEPVTAFLFGDKADGYGLFLRANGIKNVLLYVLDKAYAKKQGKAFSRALWAYDLCSSSALDGSYILYYGGGLVFGVSRSEPEGRATAPQAPCVVSTGNTGLEASVSDALKQKIAFEHDGVMYVPVNPNVFRK
jgi:hypothetical protein